MRRGLFQSFWKVRAKGDIKDFSVSPSIFLLPTPICSPRWCQAVTSQLDRLQAVLDPVLKSEKGCFGVVLLFDLFGGVLFVCLEFSFFFFFFPQDDLSLSWPYRSDAAKAKGQMHYSRLQHCTHVATESWLLREDNKMASACRRMSCLHPKLQEIWQRTFPFPIPNACTRNKFWNTDTLCSKHNLWKHVYNLMYFQVLQIFSGTNKFIQRAKGLLG